MRPKDKGIIVEATFKLMALQRGWTISQPFGDNAPYDFIVDNGSSLLRVQCKHLQKNNNTYKLPVHSRVGAKRLGSLSYKGRVDFMFGFNLEDEVHVWVNIEDCGISEITFKVDPSRNKTTNLIRDYPLLGL